jgi:RNA polymerase sigma-70 factor, ECF subfamily
VSAMTREAIEAPVGTPTEDDFPRLTDPYRRELLAHCCRMMGSIHDAEDQLQETYLRAWRSYHAFENRSSLRTWLYRIATNTCLTALDGKAKRPLPTGLGAPSLGADEPLVEQGEVPWLEPVPDAMLGNDPNDPASVVTSRESIRLALIAALQHLPARQRAVLILREVLQWKASEVAALLETTVASVNSALQRARATLAENNDAPTRPIDELDEEHQQLLDKYAAAFERYDINEMVALLHDDAVLSMPPYELWLRGPEDIVKWWTGPGAPCANSKLLPLMANGLPAFAQYRPNTDGPGYHGWALQVLEFSGGKISFCNSFLDTEALFPLFGLPQRLDAQGQPIPD